MHNSNRWILIKFILMEMFRQFVWFYISGKLCTFFWFFFGIIQNHHWNFHANQIEIAGKTANNATKTRILLE